MHSTLTLCYCVVAKSSLVVHDIQSGVGAMLNVVQFSSSSLRPDLLIDSSACNPGCHRCVPGSCISTSHTVFGFACRSFFVVKLTLLVVLFSSDLLRLELATMGSLELSRGFPALLEHHTGLCLLSGPEIAQGDAAASLVLTAGQQDKSLGPLVSGVS